MDNKSEGENKMEKTNQGIERITLGSDYWERQDKAYAEGQVAKRSGIAVSENPYSDDPRHSGLAWRLGWESVER